MSQSLMIDETTLTRYVKRVKSEGVSGLLEYRCTGGKTRLTLLQGQELKLYLKDNTKRTAREISGHIYLTYKIKFSATGVTKLLRRLGFAYKKPKIVPGKADRGKQEEFLRTCNNLKTNLGPNDQIYFLDSIHPEHNTTQDLHMGGYLKER